MAEVMFEEQREKIFKKLGWVIENESPYKIRHKDGSHATGQAAYIVEEELLKHWRNYSNNND